MLQLLKIPQANISVKCYSKILMWLEAKEKINLTQRSPWDLVEAPVIQYVGPWPCAVNVLSSQVLLDQEKQIRKC